MKHIVSLCILCGLSLAWTLSVRAQSFGDPGFTYDILGNTSGEQFTSPVVGGNFNASSFDLLSQVLDKNKGKFYWESATPVGQESGDIFLRDWDDLSVPNVGIGALNAPLAKLHIKGDDATSAKALRIENEAGAIDDDLMVVQNNGYVGIGTASPGDRFHIQNDTSDDLMVVQDDGKVGIGTVPTGIFHVELSSADGPGGSIILRGQNAGGIIGGSGGGF